MTDFAIQELAVEIAKIEHLVEVLAKADETMESISLGPWSFEVHHADPRELFPVNFTSSVNVHVDFEPGRSRLESALKTGLDEGRAFVTKVVAELTFLDENVTEITAILERIRDSIGSRHLDAKNRFVDGLHEIVSVLDKVERFLTRDTASFRSYAQQLDQHLHVFNDERNESVNVIRQCESTLRSELLDKPCAEAGGMAQFDVIQQLYIDSLSALFDTASTIRHAVGQADASWRWILMCLSHLRVTLHSELRAIEDATDEPSFRAAIEAVGLDTAAESWRSVVDAVTGQTSIMKRSLAGLLDH